MTTTSRRHPRELVLVGGGHAHVQVLRQFAMRPPPDTHLTVVLDTPVAVYSGMVPGFAAGQYRAEELEIDVLPLARLARARVILDAAVGVDAKTRRIALRTRPAVRYDLASFDIGSTVAGLELPGVREHAYPTRPIGRFVQLVTDIEARARAASRGAPFDVVVVGGGAGGVELAFVLEARLRALSAATVRVHILHAGPRILPGNIPAVADRIQRQAETRGITIECGRRVATAERGAVTLESGERYPADALLWVTGAASLPIFRDAGLPTDARGFVSTRPTLQVQGHDDLFAVGDCATLADYPRTPKAGVYAVRQGPVLTRNLRAALAGERLRRYRPQHDFLTLLNLGDGTAVGAKWGRAFEGRRVMWLKDWIDRRFVRRFQVLAAGGELTAAYRQMPPMAGGPLPCGGCAAKVGQSVLTRALGRIEVDPKRDESVLLGLERPDDAAAMRTPGGDLLVSSIDAFKAFTDDPYLVGRVAAVNACSDLYAVAATPRYALALVAVPQAASGDEAEEILFQVMSGARGALGPLGVTLVGGHTTTATELMVGFTIEGFATAPESLLRIDRLEVGQALLLSKGLGTGVVLHADMQGRAAGPWLEATIASMQRANDRAARGAVAAGATAMTDVTGFGLVGHLAAMARASGVTAEIDVGALPALSGAAELLRAGLRSTFHPENERARHGIRIESEAAQHPSLELLFDPQTSGGLLFGVPAVAAADAVHALRDAGDERATAIGWVRPARADGAPIVIVGGGGVAAEATDTPS